MEEILSTVVKLLGLVECGFGGGYLPSGSLQVGKVGNNILGCDYAYGGAEITAPAYQVLTGTNTFAAYPLPASAGQEPIYNAIKMGTDTNGAPGVNVPAVFMRFE